MSTTDHHPAGGLSVTQPVLVAAIRAFVASAAATAVTFGVPLSDDQTNAVLGLISTGGPLLAVVLAWRASKKVTPLAAPSAVHPVTGQRVPLVLAEPPAVPGAASGTGTDYPPY
jgi:hypothetical protein